MCDCCGNELGDLQARDYAACESVAGSQAELMCLAKVVLGTLEATRSADEEALVVHASGAASGALGVVFPEKNAAKQIQHRGWERKRPPHPDGRHDDQLLHVTELRRATHQRRNPETVDAPERERIAERRNDRGGVADRSGDSIAVCADLIRHKLHELVHRALRHLRGPRGLAHRLLRGRLVAAARAHTHAALQQLRHNSAPRLPRRARHKHRPATRLRAHPRLPPRARAARAPSLPSHKPHAHSHRPTPLLLLLLLHLHPSPHLHLTLDHCVLHCAHHVHMACPQNA
mmetsp:Transcript_3332/g.9189  ORF Transcript_3332/g.9189 Transcript_3332/m.9189 type:complete len:288 (-) Transcript_3332:1542-2405(-)